MDLSLIALPIRLAFRKAVSHASIDLRLQPYLVHA